VVPAYRQKARSINQSKAIYFGLALSGDMLVKCLCRNLLIYTLAIEFGKKLLYCKSNHTLISGFEFWAVGSLLSHNFEPNTTSLKNRLLFNPICELRRRPSRRRRQRFLGLFAKMRHDRRSRGKCSSSKINPITQSKKNNNKGKLFVK